MKIRTIANVRIHVERVIGSLRQKYSILEQTISITFLGVSDNTTTLDETAAVSCHLVNLSFCCAVRIMFSEKLTIFFIRGHLFLKSAK